MSYQEKRITVSLMTSIVIFVVYSNAVFQRYQAESAETATSLRFWGVAFLILIGVSIVSKIIAHIVFSILNTIITRETDPEMTDEMDELIELKATRNSYWTFIIGVVLGMASQAAGLEPLVLFLCLIISGFFAEIVSDASQLYFYRRGV